MNTFNDIFNATLLAMCVALAPLCLFALVKAVTRRERWRIFVMSCSTAAPAIIGYSAWLGIRSAEHDVDLRFFFLGVFIQNVPDMLRWLWDKLKRRNVSDLAPPTQVP